MKNNFQKGSSALKVTRQNSSAKWNGVLESQKSADDFRSKLAGLVGLDLSNHVDQVILNRQIKIQSEQLAGTKASVLLLKARTKDTYGINGGIEK